MDIILKKKSKGESMNLFPFYLNLTSSMKLFSAPPHVNCLQFFCKWQVSALHVRRLLLLPRWSQLRCSTPFPFAFKCCMFLYACALSWAVI